MRGYYTELDRANGPGGDGLGDDQSQRLALSSGAERLLVESATRPTIVTAASGATLGPSVTEPMPADPDARLDALVEALDALYAAVKHMRREAKVQQRQASQVRIDNKLETAAVALGRARKPR